MAPISQTGVKLAPIAVGLEMSRTKKRDYSGSRRSTPSCRNHGSCGYCFDNRTHKFRTDEDHAQSVFDDYLDGPEERVSIQYYQILQETDAAIQVSIFGEKARMTWFQKRNVEINRDARIIVMPLWIAEAKELDAEHSFQEV